jgi:hypothetical protein
MPPVAQKKVNKKLVWLIGKAIVAVIDWMKKGDGKPLTGPGPPSTH